MPNAKEIFESTLNELGHFLTTEGFRRSGNHFRKRLPNGEVRWSIESQKSRHNTQLEGSFTFWIHAEWKHRPASYEDWEPKQAWYGGAGGRIGDLLPRKEDTWWDIGEKTSPQLLAAQLKTVFAAYALPFLRQFETEEDIRKHLRNEANGSMRQNYPHALQMLNFDIRENKTSSEIEESVNTARRLGRTNGVYKEVIEADIQRVLNRKMREPSSPPAKGSGFPYEAL